MSAKPQKIPERAILAKILKCHLPYEITQLVNTYTVLCLFVFEKEDPIGQTVANALIESFSIHARQLNEFFESRKYVRADSFTTDSYQPRSIDAGLERKLNTQIAHLTSLRTDIAGEKIGPADRERILSQLMTNLTAFENALNEEWRPSWKRDPGWVFSPASGLSATNNVRIVGTG